MKKKNFTKKSKYKKLVSHKIKSTKNKFENIKSKYIVQKIFENLTEKKTLKIIRRNKILHNNLEISIDNYKKFSQIEIEITPEENKYGKFININKNEDIYFHIYFNEGTKEIKKNYSNENEKIKKIKIIIDYPVVSFNSLFKECDCIKSISFIKFNRSNINNMSNMFYRCRSLT